MFLHKKDMDWTRILQTDKQTRIPIYPLPKFCLWGRGDNKIKGTISIIIFLEISTYLHLKFLLHSLQLEDVS